MSPPTVTPSPVGQQIIAPIGFGLLGFFVIYLLSTVAFNHLVKTGEHLKGMQPNEKIAIFIGMTMGLLLTLMLSPILLSFPHIGVGLTILIGIAFVYLGRRRHDQHEG